MDHSIASEPVRLSFESKQQVIVVPENEDRFLTTASAAALACQQAEAGKEFRSQFEDLLAFVHEWCEGQAAKVRACYLTVGDVGLNVIVCLQGDDYDFEFDDPIAELDLEIFRRFPKCKVEVMQIPNQEALTDQIPTASTSEVLLIYGHSE